LQIPVASAKPFRFLLQRVVVGHFPGHASIAGDESEYGKTTEKAEGHEGVNSLMRDMDASQPAAQRMGYHQYEIFLPHSLSGPIPVGSEASLSSRGPPRLRNPPKTYYRTLKLYQATGTMSTFTLDCK